MSCKTSERAWTVLATVTVVVLLCVVLVMEVVVMEVVVVVSEVVVVAVDVEVHPPSKDAAESSPHSAHS
jgi:hypothetical protein